MVLEKTLESPLGCKEIKSINPKGNKPWTDAEAEALILWPLDVKRWLIRKAPDAGKDWNREEKGVTEDEMVGWHHHSMDMSLSKLQEIVKDKEVSCASLSMVSQSQTELSK